MAGEGLRRRIGGNPVARFGYRAMVVGRSPEARKKPRESIRYLFRSREVSNYTYEIANVDEMVSLLADALGSDAERVSGLVEELHNDGELREALVAGLRTNPRRDHEARYGKRAIDYCIIRIRKPRMVVELGTHDGLGTAVMLRALQRNAAEGDDGRVITCDTAEEAGWLVPENLRDRMTFHVGDAREIVERAAQEHGVDYLNCDIGPHWEGKAEVYEGLCRDARGEFVIRTEVLDDTSALPEIARRHGARYVSFKERPERHFWPGNLIGIAAFPRSG